MSSRDRKKAVEHLQGIIDLCNSIEAKGRDPFTVDVDEVISAIKKHLGDWKSFEELCLDAEAVDGLSSLIKLQSDWIKDRSTSLYRDPFLLGGIIKKAPNEKIAEVFLKAWHPIVELEQMSAEMLLLAMQYWKGLLPIDERWKKQENVSTPIGFISREELVRNKIISEKTFNTELNELWNELKQDAESGEIRYQDFIYADTFIETIKRAYLTSFLITYGYAALKFHESENEIYIQPIKAPKGKLDSKIQSISIPISISMDDWRKSRKGVIKN